MMYLDLLAVIFLAVFFYRTLVKLKNNNVKFVLFDYFPKLFNVKLKYLTYISVSLAILYLFLVLSIFLSNI